MKVQEAIFLTMKDKHSASLLQNASTDHYSERDFTDKQKRMSEISRAVKNDTTPPHATERHSLGGTSRSMAKHHSKSPHINIMIQRTPTSSNVYKSAVVQLESKSDAKQATITLQAQKSGKGAQNNRYNKNAEPSSGSQMSESKQHVMQQLSGKQLPKQFDHLRNAKEQTESPLRTAQPVSFRFGKDKSPPVSLPTQ